MSTRARAIAPGLALALVIGGAALELQRALPARLALPDVLVALFLGSLVVNSPLSKWLGLAANDRGRNRYGHGLAFVGRTVLRASVVLMGLRIEARLFESRQLLAIGLALLTALPATYLMTHALAVPLKVHRRLADMIATGTMICGASAVNAVAPVIGARRQDQGVALATIFLYSAVALVLFRSFATAAGLTTPQGGIWSGLAVNDLASAVALGAQMGSGGAEMAAASKSARVLMLAPVLILFSLWGAGRSVPAERPAGLRLGRTILGYVPGFVVGFLILALLRAAGDRLLGAAPGWRAALALDRQVVAFATVTVSAGIGLHLELKGLLSAGARAVVLGAVASATMSGVTLALVVLAGRGMRPQLLTAAAALAGAGALWLVAQRLRVAMAAGAPQVSGRHRAITSSGAVFDAALTASGAHRPAAATGVTGEHRTP
ncbi:MAG TPA: putative sulfate exporter family transporter [Polyangia bacterium]|nr:putative sulfate exporter family transporter [Polyangia bacterium]